MSGPPAARGPRPRELGVRIGELEPGPQDAITDVAGVEVGHGTGRGGVTARGLPHADVLELLRSHGRLGAVT